MFCLNNSGFEVYLFQLVVLLKPDYNCCNNFALSWVDKVLTWTQSRVLFIANDAFWFALLGYSRNHNTNYWPSQSKIKGISRILQRLRKYFNGTIISTLFVPLSPVWRVIFTLKLNESVIILTKINNHTIIYNSYILHYYHKLPDAFE